LKSWLPHGRKIGTLLWRATKDGFEASVFHKKCDNVKASLTIITSEFGKKFGGFTALPWEGSTCKVDISAFVFSLTHKTKHVPFKNLDKSIRCYQSYCPTFGDGCDIYIADNAN
jgi:hypothetical protein